AATTAAFVLDLLALPLHLTAICGAVFIVLMAGATKFLPETWEWPLAPSARVIAFESGHKAAFLADFRRVQVYDAEGRFSDGWFMESSSSFRHINKKRALIQWDTKTGALAAYAIDGRSLEERQKKSQQIGDPSRQAADFPAIFQTDWYQWPLASQDNAVAASLIGVIGASLLMWLRRFAVPRTNKKQRQRKDGVHE
ncbi:MAG: hypothetical protein LBV79_03210, partial [Candidatus Adiutrix sp.]|nr:hypothetical protein [Candidatus Adiutrix sp.]